MSLVSCRYNPSHKMKASRREIHEQKCPDRLKCKTKFKYCPYDPTELIKEEEYEKHIKTCRSRPRITKEEEAELERAKTLNDIATEQEQIKYARKKYYKNCVEEPEIVGISKATQNKNKKKQNKILNEKFAPLRQKEENIFVEVVENAIDDENEEHVIENFTGDQIFDLENDQTTNKNIQSRNVITNSKINISSSNKNNNNKDSNSNERMINPKKEIIHYRYDPNEEDKDIHKFSANIIDPNEIYMILGEEGEEDEED